MASKKRGLGRGLDALFADAAPVLEEENTAVIDKVFEKEEEAKNPFHISQFLNTAMC